MTARTVHLHDPGDTGDPAVRSSERVIVRNSSSARSRARPRHQTHRSGMVRTRSLRPAVRGRCSIGSRKFAVADMRTSGRPSESETSSKRKTVPGFRSSCRHGSCPCPENATWSPFVFWRARKIVRGSATTRWPTGFC